MQKIKTDVCGYDEMKWIYDDSQMQGIWDKEMGDNYQISELKRFVEWDNLKTKWSKNGPHKETSIFAS